MLKKTVSLILAFVLLAVFAACGSGSGDGETGTPEVSESQTQTPESGNDRAHYKDNIPENDFEGRTFRIFTNRTEETNGFFTPEYDGNNVNDALRDAVINTESRFNCKIEPVYSGLDDMAHMKQIDTLFFSGDTSYQLISGHDALSAELSMNGDFANLYDIPILDFDQPWWHYVDEQTVNGKYFCGISDFSYNSLSYVWVLYVNKTLCNDTQIDVPYQDVIDGTWTLDKLIGLTKDFWIDENGDSAPDANDIYGYSTVPELYGYLDTFGVDTTVNKGDYVTIDFDTAKVADICQKVYDWLLTSPGAHTTGIENVRPVEEFKSGKLLFAHDWLSSAVDVYRFEKGLDYGILPMPKYDENQQDYRAMMMGYPPLMVLGCTPTEDYTFIGTVVESMSAEGYRVVYPAFFDTAMKIKYTEDTMDKQMLDIINEHQCASYSWMYEFIYGFNRTLVNVVWYGKSADFASYHAASLGVAQERCDRINAGYGASEN